MLTAVPDLAPTSAWVQVLGRVTVHHTAEASHRLTGSGQRLLAVLVAAGVAGATAERIAEEIWGDEQPNPWRPALRMAVARLRKQLPDTWDVVADGGSYRITTADGWIDAWRLEEVASNRAEITEADLAWVLAGQPFSDLDLLEMVASATQNLRMLQIAVAERFCAQAPTAMSTVTCSTLTSLLRDHPYNDQLAVVVANALASAKHRTEAILALTGWAEAYASEFGDVPAAVSYFLASGGRDAEAQAASEAPPLSVPTIELVDIAKELRHLTDTPLLGRTAELETLENSRGALVTGARGAGKSRLLAALILQDPLTETTYVVGDDRLDLPLGPFAVAMPTLRDELLASAHDEPSPGRTEGSAERAASTRAWRIVLAHLEGLSAQRPQRLIVDDAHLLDPASLGLLRLLIRSNTTAQLTFVVCGRSDFDDDEWTSLMQDAERAGLDPIVLEGLGLAELELMAYQQFPSAPRQARLGLASDVLEASDGLPAVAAPLIAAADPETLALPELLSGASALARVTSSFAERSPEVVAAAAVLGHQFSIGVLIALTGLSESDIFRVLDELWSTGLIIETDDPDQVRFRHVLVQRAFLEGIPLFRRGQLHRRAAELTKDPHRQADHHANASALVPSEIAAASLRESARLYAERRQWRKVTRELRRLDELAGDHLDVASLSLWAAASDQSGADGSPHRRRAYRLAVDQGDWAAALHAALTGLPEAERPDGDQERIDMLEGIEWQELPEAAQFDRVFHLSRQYGLIGDKEKARHYADDALVAARTDDELGLSHVLRWLATRHVQRTAHQIPANVASQGSPRIQMRIAQINAINLAEQGHFAEARCESDRFAELAATIGDPLRIWHSQGLKMMFWLNDGDFDRADALALENMEFADLHDMQLGAATYIGQRVFSADCQDRLAELQPEIEPFRANLSSILLGRAALTLCDHAVDENVDIGADVDAIVTDALNRDGGTFTLLSMMFLSRFLPKYAPHLVSSTRAVLEQFGDNPILAGFGAGSFGPTTRYVAQLSSDPAERLALVHQSIEAADRHGPLLWRVRCRLDAHDLGVPDAASDAREIAAGTGLVAVVDRRTSQSL